MKVSSPPVTPKGAIKFADELEVVLSEIANGKRKPQNIPMEPIIALIQFARDSTKNSLDAAESAIAAISFSLKTEEGLEFLRCWQHGDFDAIRKEWPEAPESVFVGAEPLHDMAKLGPGWITEESTDYEVEVGVRNGPIKNNQSVIDGITIQLPYELFHIEHGPNYADINCSITVAQELLERMQKCAMNLNALGNLDYIVESAPHGDKRK